MPTLRTGWFLGVVGCALLIPSLASTAVAQRGGQHLNSPGYQRALMESRKPKAEAPVKTLIVRKKRHRRAN